MLVISGAMAHSQSLTFGELLGRPELKTLQADHKIPYGNGALQYGDLWLPLAPSKSPLPVVVLIHGGCWRADLPGPELLAFLADDLRKHGVAVWNLTYRRIGHPGGGYPGTFEDIANGVEHLKTIAAHYELDLTRVVVSGHSAGGHLALWVAAQHRIPDGSVLKNGQALNFNAVVGIAAIPDLAYFARAGSQACGTGIIDQLVDTPKRRPATLAFGDTSPAEMLPLGVKQVLLHGVFDGIVPPAIGSRYQVHAKAMGDDVKLIALENAGHFELIAPWTEPGKVVVTKILEAINTK